MTFEQIRLARAALGLPNHAGKSFRNRFLVHPDTADGIVWTEMVSAGLALSFGNRALFGKLTHFSLTRDAATQALFPGERLDTEDF